MRKSDVKGGFLRTVYETEITEIIETEEFTARSLPRVMDQLDMDRQYKELMYIYEAAIQQITAKLKILKGEFEFSNDRNPISSISGRVKSKESIIHKMQVKGLPMTASMLVANVQDVAGVRVICPFISDVYEVVKMLVKHRDIEVVATKDYIHNPKPNGYRSFHLIITTEVYFSEHMYKVPVEIQIRTIAMDFWATTEHQLRYKKEQDFSEEEHEKMKRCADLMAEADKLMQEVAGEFGDEQW